MLGGSVKYEMKSNNIRLDSQTILNYVNDEINVVDRNSKVVYWSRFTIYICHCENRQSGRSV